MWFEYTLQLLTGLLTPVIAVLTVLIAWRQYKTAKQKLTFDLFDRRLRIYEDVKNYLLLIIRDGDVEFDESSQFRNSVSEAEFLFRKEVIQYIDTIYQRAIKLRDWNRQYRDYSQTKPEGYEHDRVTSGIQIESEWLAAQLELSKKIFRKYLDIAK